MTSAVCSAARSAGLGHLVGRALADLRGLIGGMLADLGHLVGRAGADLRGLIGRTLAGVRGLVGSLLAVRLAAIVAVLGLVAEVERLAQLLERGRADARHLVEGLEVDLALAAALEDLVGQLGADAGLDQLVTARRVHVWLGHGGFSSDVVPGTTMAVPGQESRTPCTAECSFRLRRTLPSPNPG